MTRVLWLGPPGSGDGLVGLCAAVGVELIVCVTSDEAVRRAEERAAAVAVVPIDTDGSVAAVEQLRAARPYIKIIGATELGIPIQLSRTLDVGVSDLLDLRGVKPAEIIRRINGAVGQQRQQAREHEILSRLHRLNEDFLKGFMSLGTRNVELEQQLSSDAESLGQEEAGPYRILVIDDEPSVRKLFELMLKGDLEVTTADSGEAGLELFGANPFELVITDKNLPAMDGHEVMRAVLAQRPETDVIMITGYGSLESAIDAVEAGAAAYLLKPFDDISVVIKKVEDVIAAQRGRLGKQRYLHVVNERNRDFLERYREIRGDLEDWMMTGKPPV